MIKIMLVDDHKMVREGIRKLLEFEGDCKVVLEAGNGKEALNLLCEKEDKPDLIILDINMPEMNGIEFLKCLKKKRWKSKVLILTSNNDIDFLVSCIDLDIDGYLLKSSDSVELLRAVHYVCAGKRFIQPSLIPLLNAKLMARDMEADKFNKLSDREKDVIRYVALGLLNKEIGEKMGISERTVKNHLSNIFKKIDCSDSTQAAIFAIRNGLVKIQ